MNTKMHIFWRMKKFSPKARFTKWAECADPFWTMHEYNCGYDGVRSMQFKLEHVSESWTLQQRTGTFFCYDKHNMRKPVRIIQFKIKFLKT